MKVAFFGTSDFGIPSLEALKASNHSIICIVTTPDKPQGRNLKTIPSPVKEWALKNDIPIIDYSKENPLPAVQKLQAEVFVVISFGVILSKAVLEVPRISLNVHSSLLPRYRGPAPMHWALLNGDRETGVTVMRMVEKLDAGDILLQKSLRIDKNDDIRTLSGRLSRLGAETLLESLDLLKKSAVYFLPQEKKTVTYARKITKEDGRIDWNRPADEIRNQVRAFLGWPNSYSFYQGKRLLFLEASIETGDVDAQPGTILEAGKHGLTIAAVDGALRVTRLQMEGKNPLPAADFFKGIQLNPGVVLE